MGDANGGFPRGTCPSARYDPACGKHHSPLKWSDFNWNCYRLRKCNGRLGSRERSVQVDGVPLATLDKTSPYSFSLNTATFSNGSHSLTASAWDSANNVGTSNPVPVFFSNSNPGNPAQFGMWSGTVSTPLLPVHSALLPDGKIFMSDAQSAGANAFVWDPATYSSTSVTAPVNIFCNGMEQMADGRLFIAGGHAGGHIGLTFAGIFDPSSNSWTARRIWLIDAGTRPRRCCQTAASL